MLTLGNGGFRAPFADMLRSSLLPIAFQSEDDTEKYAQATKSRGKVQGTPIALQSVARGVATVVNMHFHSPCNASRIAGLERKEEGLDAIKRQEITPKELKLLTRAEGQGIGSFAFPVYGCESSLAG